MEATRYDAVPFKATRTAEGYIVDSPVVGRAGIQLYRRADGRTVREYRPHAAVFDPMHLAALRGRPIIDGHILQVDASNVRAHTIGTILSEGRRDEDGHLRADIIIHDPAPVLSGGKRELSLGYRVIVNDTPGVTPEGERYDTVVERIVMVDHLALVGKGRAGVARLNLDGDDAVSVALDAADGDPPAIPPPPAREEGQMPNLVTVRLDGGLSYDSVPQEVAHALQVARDTLANERSRFDTALAGERQQREAAVADATRRADQAEAERDAMKRQQRDQEAAVAQARADAAAETRARMEIETAAKAHGVETRADMTDRALREAVVRKIDGADVRFDGKSDDYVAFAFDAALANAAKAAQAAAQNRAAVNGHGPAARADAAPAAREAISSAAAAREAMLRRRAAF